MPLLQFFEATDVSVEVKFASTVKISSLTTDKFKLYLEESTPTLLTDPFVELDLINNYDSIAHRLTLYFADDLTALTSYTLVIEGLEDVGGIDLPSSSNTFTTDEMLDPLPTVPEEPPVIIEDNSIRSAAFMNSEIIYASNPEFYITDTDVEMNELMVESSRNSGRITIRFSARPAAHFLTERYFKAQKKPIQRAASRWESVDVQISLDSVYPWVYVDFPSNDATPVWGVADATYFEGNTKYRIRISKDVGV